ncbi:unnamed protein product [Candida verbasci]|uniref:Growth regulation protein n=1 Tax=Candida verbasci TaxID=1227364 RepID=A0A9W4XC99_9ASCO|nr:unnamed protein product [Candida verbasci]
MSQDIITQVTPESNVPASTTTTYIADEDRSIDYNSKIHLNVRGINFKITRDELMSLPESILLCLFPNGVFLDIDGQVITNLTEDDIVYVNFDPLAFEYIINVFNKAQKDLEENNYNNNNLTPITSYDKNKENILQTKPSIIVLREDLDFYVIPPIEGLDFNEMKMLKIGVSKELLDNRLIFSGLGYKFESDGSESLGPAEKHLFDMLCSSGFEVNDSWGSRSLEPGKCVISSLQLVRLKTNKNETPPESPNLTPVTSNASTSKVSEKDRSRSRSRIAQLANSARAASRSLSSKRRSQIDSNQTKLLLFWRKPARKCWWSHDYINVEIETPKDLKSLSNLINKDSGKLKLKVHIRRVWTLELSVIGVQ